MVDFFGGVLFNVLVRNNAIVESSNFGNMQTLGCAEIEMLKQTPFFPSANDYLSVKNQ